MVKENLSQNRQQRCSRLEKKLLLERVLGYLRRARSGKDKNARMYHLDKVGIYRVIGGTDDSGSCSGLSFGNRYEIKNDLVEGRFIDAVAYAVQQNGYWGWYCTGHDNPNHGFVVKADVKSIKRRDDLSDLETLI